MNCAMTYFDGVKRPDGKRHATSWDEICKWLSKPVVEHVKESCGGFSLATFAGNRRALANVDRVYAVGLDLDDLDPEPFAELPRLFGRTRSFIHTTWSSQDSAPRCRVFLLLARPVTGLEYRAVYNHVAATVAKVGIEVDRAASDPSRFWYRPAVPLDVASYRWWRTDGAPVDVEGPLRVAQEKAQANAVPVPVPSGDAGDVVARAAAYLDRCEPAIQGQNGSTQTFRVAMKLVRGFGLDEGTAFAVMQPWNRRCDPPWSDSDLKRKLRQAAERGTMAHGSLRDANRRSA